ncbi:hypothetical protein [Egicoccus halophilus]|uniref:Uncharacterized protein n=1 Tax=Egicoccus halophilus TaxID=1670830 RepID=A0A8J3AHB1_9ACTN|nr:hypothetical protein [Egicoccus halophilus]GGI09822.1 hypothetical protein GCM10011354_35980 [Egicoccus halophilus]
MQTRGEASHERMGRWVGGGLLVAIGTTNLLLGLMIVPGVGSLLQTPLQSGVGLVLLGPVLVLLGAAVLRGSRVAALVGAVAAVALLVMQNALAPGEPGAVGRTLLLALLAVALGAVVRGHREPTAAGRGNVTA